ncbi:hypothetical protein F2Q69_00000771 [Brassica cretica]|uniref:Uncharacterized protein n=1 Tax=Brassica cretica TaxID=69181 RepID=A0A8S9PAG5_BRACR|nr:hypothetical protein F2Q69_00000771 [Brassica cretica]
MTIMKMEETAVVWTLLQSDLRPIQDNTLIQEGKEMASILYTYRSCVKALPQLAADMQRSSRPERRINGPTVTHLWSMLKLLDILVQLDHLKNAKASIPNYFSWYKSFTLATYLEMQKM